MIKPNPAHWLYYKRPVCTALYFLCIQCAAAAHTGNRPNAEAALGMRPEHWINILVLQSCAGGLDVAQIYIQQTRFWTAD